MRKPCIDCGTPTSNGSRCPPCTAKREAHRDTIRGSSTQRGYDTQWRAITRVVLIRDNHTCAYCGGHATSVDHIMPKARGGTDTLANLTAACVPCNSRKRDT